MGLKISIQEANKKRRRSFNCADSPEFAGSLFVKLFSLLAVSVVLQPYHYSMKRVFLLLGSNQGDRKMALQTARERLADKAGKIIQASSVYRTGAWGNTEQPDFFNQAIEIATPLSPDDLLKACLEAETGMGRKRLEKWGERVIDIDLLFYGDVVLSHETLQVPHPHIPFRRFTLAPLAEIAPEFVHPSLDKTVRQLLEECHDSLPVERIDLEEKTNK